ncbi:formin-like protein 14 [Prunus yedoensis var. nudiflora]|uniref:Formin-like protein 14 n=1 Tax=Prunus yedoensis var. nudiflora TaxID=2094558 RepID=A0A314Z7B2_PRUYE|nr:formin-like protein 14 [Prunus yedoensis var. nudiflora]
MTLLSRFFYKRPPDGLLEFVERVYVFDSCFSTEVLPEEMYQIYLDEIITELHEEFPDSSFLAFNFREGEKRSQFAEILCEYDVTVMDYPRQYEGCPILPLSLIQHFLRVCESWLLLDKQQNVILLHCERGGWPLLAFLLASFLIFRKLHSGERKTLEIVHREAPKGFLQLLSPLNPLPSQLRYLQYVARRNIAPEWPPPERALSLDCVILRAIPNFDTHKGCTPIIRIFGRNLLSKGGLSTQMIFSMPRKKTLRNYRQEDCDVIKIDIQCLVQGDVVLECVHVDLDPEREVMMFRIMFNTAFIRSNILMLNSDNLDILWDSKERYPKGFRAEVLFGEFESISPPKAPTTILNGEEKGGLPLEAFSRVQELFNGVEWVDSNDDATLWLLKQLSVLSDANRLQNKVNLYSSPGDSEEENNASSTADSADEAFDTVSKASADSAKALMLDTFDSVPVSFENDGPPEANLASESTDHELIGPVLHSLHQQSLDTSNGSPPCSSPQSLPLPPLSTEPLCPALHPPPPLPPPPPPPPHLLPLSRVFAATPTSTLLVFGKCTQQDTINSSTATATTPLPATNKLQPPPPPPPPSISNSGLVVDHRLLPLLHHRILVLVVDHHHLHLLHHPVLVLVVDHHHLHLLHHPVLVLVVDHRLLHSSTIQFSSGRGPTTTSTHPPMSGSLGNNH